MNFQASASHLWFIVTFISWFRESDGNLYKKFDFVDICHQDGSKTKIDLKSGTAAIFQFDESDTKSTMLLKDDDFSCHIEVTTDADHGFHAYIDEMKFDEDLGSQPKCRDFLQFGRDIFILTNFRSQEYCGQKSKIKYDDDVTDSDHFSQLAISTRQGNRLHVEEIDFEMDIWLQVRQSAINKKRFLRLIVTSFKKHCPSDDRNYIQCPKSKDCIRQELFCDGKVNCARPSGDTATDEIFCQRYGTPAMDHGDKDLFQTTNIPALIGFMLSIIAATIVAGLILKRAYNFFVYNRMSTSDENVIGNQSRLNCEVQETREAFIRRSVEDESSAEQIPSAPPSYEEAIKDSDPPPPPYSPTAPNQPV